MLTATGMMKVVPHGGSIIIECAVEMMTRLFMWLAVLTVVGCTVLLLHTEKQHMATQQ